MTSLIKTKSETALTPHTTAANIMAFCRVITPQFYKGLSYSAMAAEKLAIELLTGHIEQPVLRRMCELAAQSYGIARSESSKTFFDINYILTFYRTAFNEIWCYSVEIPDGYSCSGDAVFDETTRIITERWQSDNAPDIIIKFIVERKYDDRFEKRRGLIERHHTPKFWSEQEKNTKNRLEYDEL